MADSNRSHHFFAVVVAVLCAFAAVFVVSAREVQAGGIVTECTDAGLTQALEGGGDVTFNCPGSAPHTIYISTTKNITLPMRIYGGGVITLDSMNTTRIIWVETGANLEVDGLTLTRGSSPDWPGGGAMYNGGIVTVSHSTVIDNGYGYIKTGSGGGIMNGGKLVIHESLIARNRAVLGGGVFNYDGGMLIIESSSFIDNIGTGGSSKGKPGEGSALYAHGCYQLYCPVPGVVITNSTFVGNSGYSRSGLSLSVGTTIVNTTISNNGVNNILIEVGIVAMTNTIISGGGQNCMVGSTFTGSNNIFSDATCVISGTNNRVITDVVLGPLTYAANGVPYLPLLLGSPAIDTGTNEGCPATDQRGVARPYGTNCDVGAYEYDRATYTWHMPILRR